MKRTGHCKDRQWWWLTVVDYGHGEVVYLIETCTASRSLKWRKRGARTGAIDVQRAQWWKGEEMDPSPAVKSSRWKLATSTAKGSQNHDIVIVSGREVLPAA
jgi:hypothetical protein